MADRTPASRIAPAPRFCRRARSRLALSTATATSQKPLFRWVLPSDGEDGARVEICADRACSQRVRAFTAAGSSGAPHAALPAGTYFWRLRGTANGLVGANASPAWEVTVGARSAPIDSSWGTTLDVNADGLPDLLVGAIAAESDVGVAYLYAGTEPGSDAGIATDPVAIASPAGENGLFGSSVASAGDVNGDGFADVVIGARGVAGQKNDGAAYVFLGRPKGLAAKPTALLGPATADSEFGGSVASAGDVNGDGYADVLVGALGAGAAYLYLGSANGIGATPTPLAGGGSGGMFGISVASAGDVNGDGYGDVLAGGSRIGSTGAAYLYLGSANGLSTSPLVIASPVSGSNAVNAGFGYAVASAGDVNGDGLADVVIGAIGANSPSGAAYVYLGSASGALGPPVTLDGGSDETFLFGESVAAAGDLNGDGFGDVVVATGGNDVVGGAYVFLGGAGGIRTPAAGYMEVGGSLDTTVAGAGDVNGDGFADIVAGAPWAAGGVGGVAILFGGGANGLSTLPPLYFTSPGAVDGQFGTSVASARPIPPAHNRAARATRATWATSAAGAHMARPGDVASL